MFRLNFAVNNLSLCVCVCVRLPIDAPHVCFGVCVCVSIGSLASRIVCLVWLPVFRAALTKMFCLKFL